jgi:hypothetical protein
MYGIQFGQSFIAQWEALKKGTRHSVLVANAIQAMIAKFLNVPTIEITVSASNEIRLSWQARTFRLSELGHGIGQLLFFLMTFYQRRPKTLLIDEPEIGLHPALQVQLLDSVAEMVGGQIMFATHSLGLARTRASVVMCVRNTPDGSIAEPFEKLSASGSRYPEMLGEMSFATWAEFGAEQVLIVEGVTDIQAVAQLLRKLGKEQRVMLLPMAGSQLIDANRAHLLNEFSRFNVPVTVMLDSEKNFEDEPLEPQRQAFLQACAKHKINTFVLRKRALENYWTERAVKEAIGESAVGLQAYQRLADLRTNWAKRDNWRIAAKVTKEELLASDLGAFLNDL